MKHLTYSIMIAMILGLVACGGKTVNVACGDSVKSKNLLNEKSITAICPKDCGLSYSVWGTEDYTTDSSICATAVHAGVHNAKEGGKVKVSITAGKQSYTGSAANGVTSRNWGPYDSSFTVK